MTVVRTLSLKVTPHAHENSLLAIGGDSFVAKVTAPPDEGKANKAVIKLLSKALHLAKSRFTIIHGATDRHKVIGILSE